MSGSAQEKENGLLREEVKELRAKLATSLADNKKLWLSLRGEPPQSSAIGGNVNGQHLSASNSEGLRGDPLTKVPSEIANLIFQYLSLTDLMSCRLVNSAWRTQSTPVFKTSGVVILDLDQFDEFGTMMEPRQASGDFPFSRFSLKMANSFNDDILSFFATFGPAVRDLTLEDTNWVDFYPDKLVEQLDQILRSTPNLEQLHLHVNCDRICAKWLGEILKVTVPSVKVLRLTGTASNCREVVDSLHLLNFIPWRFPFLKSLVLKGYPNLPRGFEDAFQGLKFLESFSSRKGDSDLVAHFPDRPRPDFPILKKPKLKDLSLCLSQNQALALALKQVSSFEQILIAQSSTLQHLTLDLELRNGVLPTMIKVPPVPSLKSLNISGKFGKRNRGSALKPSDVPALHRVTVPSLKTFNYLFPINGGEEPFLSVNELVVDYKGNVMSGTFKWLKDIARVVPNLKKLRIEHEGILPSHLILIFKYHSKLEELDVEFRGFVAEDLNNAICGLPSFNDFFSTIALEGDRSEAGAFSVEELQEFALAATAGPRLRGMKDLRRLRLATSSQSLNDQTRSKINVVGVLMCLLQMHPLESLILERITTLPDQYITRLKKHHVWASITGNVYRGPAFDGLQLPENIIREDDESYSELGSDTDPEDLSVEEDIDSDSNDSIIAHSDEDEVVEADFVVEDFDVV